MRVAIIAESFLPQTNGVVHTVVRVLEHLAERGDDVIVIAPGTRHDSPTELSGARIVRVPSFAMPKYRKVRVAPGGVRPPSLPVRPWMARSARSTGPGHPLGSCLPD